jgi:membrane peptidoglycan carboxypeptidase
MGIPPAKPDQHYPGIPTSTQDLTADSLITLGKSRVSAINMANTYATIANGGQRADVHVIEKVTAQDGHVLYRYKPHTTQAVKPDINDDVSYAMQQVVQHGTGTNALALGRPAAGKTGTATDDAGDVSSSWFVGFTPQMATAVMYVRGNGNGALNNWLPPYNGAAGYFGAGYPTATWTAVMQRDLAGMPVEKFPPPAYVTGKPPEAGHTPPPPPPPTITHSVRPTPTHSAPPPTTSAPPPTSSAPPPPPTSSGTGSTCSPPGHCHSPTPTITPSPTLPSPTAPGGGGGHGGPSASARPMAMESRGYWSP